MLQQRKIILAITVLYTLLIFYFIFLGSGRLNKVELMTEYTFIFRADSFYRLPSLIDFLHPTLMNFVDLGNIAAFIPFGIFGAAIGFGAYRVGFRTIHVWRNLVFTALSAIIILMVVWGVFGMIRMFA